MQHSLLLLVVFGASLIASTVSFALAIQSLFYPLPMDYADGLPYFINTTTMYKSFYTQPYLITYYPPLYYLLFNTFSRFVQLNGAPFFYERFLELIAELASTALVYLILKKGLRANTFVSALGALLFLSFYPSYYSISSNPELFELCFSLLGVFILFRKPKNYEYLSGLSMAVAFLFKQTAILLFIGMLAFLIVKNRKNALKFFAVFSIALILVCLPLNYYSHGRFFFSVFILPFLAPLIPQQAVAIIALNLGMPLFFLLILTFLENLTKRTLLLYFLLFALLPTFVTVGKWGSNETYFAPLFAVSSILGAISLNKIAYVLARRRDKPTTKKFIHLFILYLIVFSLASSTVIYLRIAPSVTNNQTMSEIEELKNISKLQGSVLFEDPGYALITRKPLVLEPSMFWLLENKGLWNDSQILLELKNANFSAIVLDTGPSRLLLYKDFNSTLNEYYHKVYKSKDFECYEPNLPKNISSNSS